MNIAFFPTEVWEAICRYCENRHLARLVETGNADMRRVLASLRERRSVFTDHGGRGHSSMVVDFILGAASEVVTTAMHLGALTLSACTRMRRLTLVGSASASPRDNVLTCRDFSALASLELLDIGPDYALTAPLSLPPSLTHLKVGDVRVPSPVEQLESLTSLAQLCLCFDYAVTPDLHLPVGLTSLDVEHGARDVLSPLLHSNDLPHLTKLCLTDRTNCTIVGGRFPEAVTDLSVFSLATMDMTTLLPTRLRRLRVGTYGRLDLSELVSNQTALETLEAYGFVRCTIGGRLPPSLKRLRVDRLVIPAGENLLCSLNRVPTSIERFSFNKVQYAPEGGSVRLFVDAEELTEGLSALLPRLCLYDLRAVWCAAQCSTEVDITPAFLPFFERCGLGVSHMKWLRGLLFETGFIDYVPSVPDMAEMICTLPPSMRTVGTGIAQASPSENGVCAYRGNRRAAKLHRDVCHNRAYSQHAFVVLEEGVTNELHILSESPLGPNGCGVISAEAARNLVYLTLALNADALLQLTMMFQLSRVAFDRLAEITVFYSVVDTKRLAQLVRILHHWRSRMPRLEHIAAVVNDDRSGSTMDFNTGSTMNFNTESKQMLGEMRLYPVAGTCSAVYRTEKPAPRKESVSTAVSFPPRSWRGA